MVKNLQLVSFINFPGLGHQILLFLTCTLHTFCDSNMLPKLSTSTLDGALLFQCVLWTSSFGIT